MIHSKIRVLLGATFLAFLISAPVVAQTPESGQAFIGSTLDAATLRDLPLGENVYSVLETTQPEVIADRFNSGGLNAGEASRMGAFLASWSQTLFRIGDVDVTDPAGSGAPLLFPELFFWQKVDVATGLMTPDIGAPGLAVTLEPRRPTAAWTTSVNASGSGGALASPTPNGPAPPIARLDNWTYGSALVSGPVIADRLGIVAGGALTRASKFQRASTVAADSDLTSGFVHLLFTPSPGTQSRTIGWIQRARTPFEYWRALAQPAAATRDLSGHVQTTWERRPAMGMNWRAFAGLTARSRSNDLDPTPSLTIDRLNDGPIPSIVAARGDITAGRWTLGARAVPDLGSFSPKHAAEIGVDVGGSWARLSNQYTGAAGEVVNGIPARVWTFANPGTGSKRHTTTVTAFGRDHIAMSPTLSLDAGLRFESTSGSADGAATGVSWHTVLPSASLRWQFSSNASKTLVLAYRRAANRLNLDLLAYGDPAASTAVVTRFFPAPPAGPLVADPRAPIVARAGPGTGGDPAFSRIDPDLARPYTDEFVVGVEAHPRAWLKAAMIGTARREANLLGAVNVGVSASDYSPIAILDTGVDVFHAADQVVTVYDRNPSSFGRDRYLLTNPGQQAATVYALTLSAEASSGRLFSFFGATASAATGEAANIGYGPLENDQDGVGELFGNINAATNARGRLFSDRAFTIKWTTVYKFPWDVRVGAIARYQDGQPFARLVIAPQLNQGTEAVRAYENAGTRFTYTGTLDLRLQKGFTLGGRRMDAILDFYNLATRSNEVEEYVITGPDFRTPTAIEPPRAVHLGVRVTF